MDAEPTSPLTTILEDEGMATTFQQGAENPKQHKRPPRRQKPPTRSHSRQTLTSRGKSRIRLPSDRGAIAKEDHNSLNLVLKKADSSTQQDSANRPSTSESFKNKLPPIFQRFDGEQQHFSVLGQDLALPALKTNARDEGNAFKFKPISTPEPFVLGPLLQEQIEDILHIHSLGVPIEITLNVHADYRSGTTPGARGIFHCPKCLAHWQQTGLLPESCDEVSRVTRGPVFELNISEAAKLLAALQSSEARKFVSNDDLASILPLLNNASSDEERQKIVKAFERGRHPKSTRVTLGPSSLTELSQQHQGKKEAEENRKSRDEVNRKVALQVARTMREKFMTLPHSTTSLRCLGLRSNDGAFYPGFFAHQTSQTSDVTLADLAFSARGRFDDDGCYHAHRGQQDPHVFSDVRFPTLGQTMTSQTSRALAADDLASNFRFVFQDGPDAPLGDLLASGVWFRDEQQESFFPGTYDSKGRFIAAGCVNRDGYLVPGSCDSQSLFVPFSEQDENGNRLQQARPASQASEKVVLQLQHTPRIPLASEMSSSSCWRCVRGGEVVSDPRLITVHVEEEPGDPEADDYSVYVGGELGPDGEFYPYGKYEEDGSFVPGGPPIASKRPLTKAFDKQVATNDADPPNRSDASDSSDQQQADDVTPAQAERDDVAATKSVTKAASPVRSRTALGLSDERDSRSTGELDESRRRRTSASPTKQKKKTSFGNLPKTSSRNLRSQERIYNRRSDVCLQRTPSIAFIQEKNSGEVGPARPPSPPSSKPHATEILNPTVKNRTGKPSTKPGALAEAALGTAQGGSAASQLMLTDQARRDSMALTSFTAEKVGSRDTLEKQPMGKRSSAFEEMGAPVRPQTESRQSLSRRVSSLTSGRGTIDNRRSQAGVDGGSNTPASVARQREIERKTRKEKAEVKAKYQNAAHHSSVSGTAPEPEQLTLGGTKPSRSGLATRDASKRNLDGTESATSAQRLPRMRQTRGETPGTGAPGQTTSSRSMIKKSTRRFRNESSTTGGANVSQQDLTNASNMSLSEMKKAAHQIQRDEKKTGAEDLEDEGDEEDFDFSDLSSVSSEGSSGGKHSSKKSNFFPILDGFSILNFTENFRFSYFAVPAYIKEHNQKMRTGVIKLPVIATSSSKKKKKNSGKSKEQEGRKSRGASNNLLKRIEKLNKME